MSWYGSHPVITKSYAKFILPARACKLCVYWVRCQIDQPRLWQRGKCAGCGAVIDLQELYNKHRAPIVSAEELAKKEQAEIERREEIIYKILSMR